MGKAQIYLLGLLFASAFPASLIAAGGLPAAALPVGTQVSVELTTTLSSSANRVGDPFVAEIEEPVFAGGEQVIPAGSTLRGHVTFVKRPGRLRGRAEMRLEADSILTKNRKQMYSFKAVLVRIGYGSGTVKKGNEGMIEGQGKSIKRGARDTGIATAAGAGIGAMTAGGQGALYGAGIGAVAMAIGLLARHHKNVVVNAGTNMTFQLTTLGQESKPTSTRGYSAPFVCATCQ